MEKQTLKFRSFEGLSSFAKELTGGYLINTNNLTLTARISEEQVNTAVLFYKANAIETNDKVYTYDKV